MEIDPFIDEIRWVSIYNIYNPHLFIGLSIVLYVKQPDGKVDVTPQQKDSEEPFQEIVYSSI